MRGRYSGGVRWIRRPRRGDKILPLAYPGTTLLAPVRGGAFLLWTFNEDDDGKYQLFCFLTHKEAAAVAKTDLGTTGVLENVRPTMKERIAAINSPRGTTVLAIPADRSEESFLDEMFHAAELPAVHAAEIAGDERYKHAEHLTGHDLQDEIERMQRGAERTFRPRLSRA